MAHRVHVLLALALALVTLAQAHRNYHRGRYYNNQKFVRPAEYGRIGDGIIPVRHREGGATPSQSRKHKHQHSNLVPFPAPAQPGGGGGLKKPPPPPPSGGNTVPGGDVGDNLGPGILGTVDLRTNLNVPDIQSGKGICPPVRLSCTVYRTRVEECSADADCGSTRKCCFDSCVQKDVCKSLVPDLP